MSYFTDKSEHKNTVELLGFYGGDREHACSAWTSTSRDLTPEKEARIPALLKMLAENGHHCYDPETEILTNKGWKKFFDLSYEDMVAAVNIKNRTVQFEQPQDIFSDNYHEHLYHIQGQQVDLLVTKGHRMVVSQKRDPKIGFGEFEFQTVEEVEGKTRKYLKSVKNNNKSKLSPGFAKLLGFFIGDGHVESAHSLNFHIRKSRKIEFLKSLPYTNKERKDDKYVISEFEIGKWFKKNCHGINNEKKLPDDFLTYSTEDFLNILDGLKNSDGTKKRNTFVYYTTSETLKNQLLALTCINDAVFSVSTTQPKNEKWSTLYRLNFSKRTMPEVAISQKGRGLTYSETWVPYSGKVYCVTVSTGAIIVKRNDKVVVSGNTPFEKSALHFLVKTDIATHIHLLKHRISVSINAQSARYRELKDDNLFVPDDWPDDEIQTYLEHMEKTYEKYHKSVVRLTDHYINTKGMEKIAARKRAKESSRFYLPYGNQILSDVQFNFRSFSHFLNLRYSKHAQREVKLVAKQMLEEVVKTNSFPLTLQAFGYTTADGKIRGPE